MFDKIDILMNCNDNVICKYCKYYEHCSVYINDNENIFTLSDLYTMDSIHYAEGEI